MARKRVLRVLFVRSATTARLPELYGFAERVDPRTVLPVALLRLATAVKLGSPHRVFFHDARREPTGNRSVRVASSVNRADVAVIELQLPLLADGLGAARSAREGGCDLVLATGPLVRAWPEAIAGLPEFDGLLDPGGAPALLCLLEHASTDCLDAAELARSLAIPPAPPPSDAVGCDRRLLDYASYRAPHPRWGESLGRSVDKGRWAATPLLLDDESGVLRAPSDVRRELEECELLGISRVALRVGSTAPTIEWLKEAVPVPSRWALVVPMPDGRARGIPELLALGAVALDMGSLVVGNEVEVERAGGWCAAARRAGLEVVGRACFGLVDNEREERGLRTLRSWGVTLDVALLCAVPPTDEASSGAWLAWSDTPGDGFIPPVRGGDRSRELAERARVHLVEPERGGLGAVASRLARWARGL